MAQTRVFMSHATPDAAFANRLADDLRNLGVDVWLDATHMGPGNFVTRINQALQRDVLILVLSPDAIASPWVQQEMSAAIARTNQGLMRPPIVVMARSVALQDIPPLWTVYHRYDAVQNYAVAVAQISREIEIEKAPYSPPVTPPQPVKMLNVSSDQVESKVSLQDDRVSLKNISYPWMVRNLVLSFLIALIGGAPPIFYYFVNPPMYDVNYNLIGGCLTPFNSCTGSAQNTSGFYITDGLAIIMWSAGVLLLLFTLISSIILIVKMRRWYWLAGVITYLGLWVFAFWGPTTKRIET